MRTDKGIGGTRSVASAPVNSLLCGGTQWEDKRPSYRTQRTSPIRTNPVMRTWTAPKPSEYFCFVNEPRPGRNDGSSNHFLGDTNINRPFTKMRRPTAPAKKSPRIRIKKCSELLSSRRRTIHQRHSYVHVHPVVRPLRTVLATGAVRAGNVPDRVAAPAAIPLGRDCRGRSIETGMGGSDLTGKTAKRPLPGMMQQALTANS